ncbi:VWFA-related domain-containing protein [Granulicella rosea]|uniref:VWFA-related domain-containing protein n=1 Tax=Granulicella rosea TaxID=474952 RepID=A0A239MFQ7_9BACT|nr:VWA domain-containing protein [Granulicella rosea]SNT41491.1 VWFA-related domain-containing protein [Granulicella rosea]
MNRKALSALLVLLLSVSPAWAQQEPLPDQPYVLKTTATIHILDIVVTDKKGKVYTNLKQDDFTIYEDAVEQRIRSFEPPSKHTMPEGSGLVVKSSADLPKIGAAPVTILVLDDLNTSFENMAYARNRIQKYLEAQPAVMKQPTTLLAATNTKFVVVKDFTQDRAELLTALHKYFPEYPWKQMKSGGGGSGAFERMGESLNSLYSMAEAFRGTPGRKTVLWVGKGFPAVDLLNLDTSSTILLQAGIKRITNALLDSRITLYTIDPSSQLGTIGVIGTSDDLQDYETRNDGQPFSDEINFSTLAPATGGKAFFSRNDIDAEVAEGTEAGSNYYTISYTPSNPPKPGEEYRQIRIKMRDPSLTAVTRDGYYPPDPHVDATGAPIPRTPKEQRDELEAEMGKAAMSTLAYNGLLLSLAPADGGKVKLGVASGGLKWTDEPSGKTRAEITVLQVAFSSKDKALAHSSQELSAEVMGRIQNPDQKAYFLIPVQMPPGTTRLRVVVRDAVNGKIGTVELLTGGK